MRCFPTGSSVPVALLLLLVPGSPSLQSAETPRQRPAPVVSPTLHGDGKVTFRVQAPRAEEVSVSGEMAPGRHAMSRDDQGLWSVTLEDIEPGIHGYSFTIDGVKQVDPGNPRLKPMRSPRTSVLHLPGGNAFDFDPAIPHGTVHYHAYHSKPIDRFREMQVYTPPGYETGEESYPLLVLQHGHSDSFATWVAYGKAHWILDHLIAAGKAEPMIVVMTDGHPIPGSYGNGRSPENTEELRRDLVEVVLPMVEGRYRVKPGRDHRAIAGLSMGGLHALTIGFNELDTFSQVGAFSAAVPERKAIGGFLDAGDGSNGRLKLLWIACGKKDRLLGENHRLVSQLEDAGIDHTFLETEGGHSWPVWRAYLEDFAPLLFR